MESFALYLLKSVIWLTGFTLVYIIFLQNERYFRLKRFFLVGGILVSFLFPLVTFHYNVALITSDANPGLQTTLRPGIVTEVISTGESGNNNSFVFLIIIYLTGIFFLVIRSFKQIFSMFSLISRNKVSQIRKVKVIRSSEFPGTFSLFNCIFINTAVEEDELEVIMDHELVHINQKHWLDLILADTIRILQWVNPFAWIYARFVKQNHEYIADEVAIENCSDPAIYKAVLVNQLLEAKVFDLSNSFNYSINNRRFRMMKKTWQSPYRKMRLLLIVPVIAIIFYAFATPEISYTDIRPKNEQDSRAVSVNQAVSLLVDRESEMQPLLREEDPLTQKLNSSNVSYKSQPTLLQIPYQATIRGKIMDEKGQPLGNVNIISTGGKGDGKVARTDNNGWFEIKDPESDGDLLLICEGYKSQRIKPDFEHEMEIIMVKQTGVVTTAGSMNPLVVIDGEISEKNYRDVYSELGYNMGLSKAVLPEEAIKKYGEKGINGVFEITTRKKALEMGLKPPFPRLSADDYPTFQGQKWTAFHDWVQERVKYPDEAAKRNISGWVSVNFIVELDGSVSNPVVTSNADPVLNEEVLRVIRSSPRWDPPKNPAVDMPFQTGINIGLRPNGELMQEPFVVVEEMPMYPGGEVELLKFIAENTGYPEEAKAKNIQGKVIVRFIVTTEGNTDGISVLKGVDPMLDNEAIRVVSLLTGFKPGKQGGKAVPVWYMVPINFTLK